MTFINSQLLPGERVVYLGRRQRWGYALPVVLLIAGIALFALAPRDRASVEPGTNWMHIAAAVLAVAAIVAALRVYIKTASSEFGVTNRRVIIKIGWFGRRTLETLLSKIEAIEVDQTLLGRVLGYGTIAVIGTGGTRETFSGIARPLEFRKQVQAQIVDNQATVFAAGSAPSGTVREERDCPWCGERILTKAKVCRWCGREVGGEA